MRYIVASRTMPAAQIEQECRGVGARNIRTLSPLKQVVCDLEPAAVAILSAIPGIIVREPAETKVEKGEVKPSQEIGVGIVPPLPHRGAEGVETLEPVYAASQGSLFTMLYNLRESMTPPILGTGATIVLIDTGMRKTHVGLRGKVIYEEDFTGGGDPTDVFDHGTGVAYLAGGGIHAPGQESGIAPGASFINLKAVGDDGIGTDEDVLAALSRALELWQDAVDRGLSLVDPEHPNFINMSLGMEDDEDPDNPMRLALAEIEEICGRRLTRWAAAGNSGPNPGTILLPAAADDAIAVGALTFDPFEVWEHSSRGPVSVGNLVKPEICYTGVSILTASAGSDTSFIVKTGTSFACPIGVGFMSLMGELVVRYGAEEMFLGMTPEQWEPFAMVISRKPQGAPIEKDNAYGWGMPMGDLIMRTFGAGAMDISSLISGIVAVGMVGMMAGTMGEMGG